MEFGFYGEIYVTMPDGSLGGFEGRGGDTASISPSTGQPLSEDVADAFHELRHDGVCVLVPRRPHVLPHARYALEYNDFTYTS